MAWICIFHRINGIYTRAWIDYQLMFTCPVSKQTCVITSGHENVSALLDSRVGIHPLLVNSHHKSHQCGALVFTLLTLKSCCDSLTPVWHHCNGNRMLTQICMHKCQRVAFEDSLYYSQSICLFGHLFMCHLMRYILHNDILLVRQTSVDKNRPQYALHEDVRTLTNKAYLVWLSHIH